MGQSNIVGGNAAIDTTWGLQPVQDGVTLIWNGVQLDTYFNIVGIVPYIIEELLAAGVDPEALTVIVQGDGGKSIQQMKSIYQPGAMADIAALNKVPDAVVYWQGNADAGDVADTAAYEVRLNTFVQDYWDRTWPGVQVGIVELLGDVEVGAAAIRTAEVNTVAANPSICYNVFTRTPTELVTSDGLHCTPNTGGSYEEAAQRVAAAAGWHL